VRTSGHLPPSGDLKLALGLDLYRGARLEVPVDIVRLVEQLGYHSVWTAEAYGSDALSPLAYLAALTTRIGLGTAVVQIAARTPTATAMHAMTIDALARQTGGDPDAPSRVMIGIGVSGPQIVEGWYGSPWGVPHQRLREYVSIMRSVFAREPLTNDGPEYPLPYVGPGSTGQGKPLRSILHPGPGIGIWIAAGGPINIALTAEVADGFLPMGWGATGLADASTALERGFAARTAPTSRAAFEIFGGCQVKISNDVAATLDAMRPLTAMYVGGMGSATHNYHRAAMTRRGYAEAADRIQELWLAGRKSEAVAAVPDEYLDDGGLYGSVSRIRERWEPWTQRGLTGLTIRSEQTEALALMADLAGTRDDTGIIAPDHEG
jgi:F420-dependent oxidoreductase-like protein